MTARTKRPRSRHSYRGARRNTWRAGRKQFQPALTWAQFQRAFPWRELRQKPQPAETPAV